MNSSKEATNSGSEDHSLLQAQFEQLLKENNFLRAQNRSLVADNKQLREKNWQLSRRGRKTVICQSWLQSKNCPFGKHCNFAHGEWELRPTVIGLRPSNHYKTKICETFASTGLCPYGERCFFIHPSHELNADIREDRFLEVSQHHDLMDLHNQMEQQIVHGECSSAAPVVPQPIEMNVRPSATDNLSENARDPMPPNEEVSSAIPDFDELAEDIIKHLDL